MPQFQSIREQVQANPQLLQAFLQQLGQSNPMLLQLINSDPQRFVDLLNAPITPAGTANEGDDDNEGQPPAGSVSIQVTPEDKEVIDRLKSMGFPEGLVVQAYFACDKNEELALNFLLSDDDN
jgi:UV excision repair protein RAD23